MASTRSKLDEIVAYFATLEDPRSHLNRRHPLPSVLVIAVLAVLAGAAGPTAIARWAVLRGGLPDGPPRLAPRHPRARTSPPCPDAPLVDVTVDVTGARNSGGVIDVPHALPVLPGHRFLWRVSRSPAWFLGSDNDGRRYFANDAGLPVARHSRST